MDYRAFGCSATTISGETLLAIVSPAYDFVLPSQLPGLAERGSVAVFSIAAILIPPFDFICLTSSASLFNYSSNLNILVLAWSYFLEFCLATVSTSSIFTYCFVKSSLTVTRMKSV